jgi:hypothetical protein
MTMQHIKCDDDHGAWLDRFTGKFVRTKGYAADGRNGWIETIGLVYDRSRDRKAIGKILERTVKFPVRLGPHSLPPFARLREQIQSPGNAIGCRFLTGRDER